jgi:hypothetical protein
VIRCLCHRDPATCRVPHGVWLKARTPATYTYPCSCRSGRTCNPVWCDCAGRPDPRPGCCAQINTPAVVVKAKAEHNARRRA